MEGNRLRRHVQKVHTWWKGTGPTELMARDKFTPAEVEPNLSFLIKPGSQPQYVPAGETSNGVPYVPTEKSATVTSPDVSDWENDSVQNLVIEESSNSAKSPLPASGDSSPARKVLKLQEYRSRSQTDTFDDIGKKVADIARMCANSGSEQWSAVNTQIQALLDLTGGRHVPKETTAASDMNNNIC